jgi:hypothetical protein
MIILSVGMPRAGSGWYYNLTHDIVTVTGGQDARQIRRRFHLQRVLTEVNCNIGALTPWRLLAVSIPSWMGNTFVIKTHSGSTPLVRRFIQNGFLKPSYIYRDPRDAMVSALENGERARQLGRTNAFSQLTGFDTALDFMTGYARIWDEWIDYPQILPVRYEDLLTDFDREVDRLLNFLGVERDAPKVFAATERYRPQSARSDQKGLHFHKGQAGRFRQKFSIDQQEILAERFGPYLERMGYEV